MAKKTLRRVTKAENEAAHRARAYTTAAPGKYRKTSKIVPRRAAEGLTAKQKSRPKQQRAPAPWAAKARETRIRNTFMREYVNEDGKKVNPVLVREDEALIKLYRRVGYPGLAQMDRRDGGNRIERFDNIFKTYPDDEVRSWLGSSEQSRALRRHWKSTRMAA